MTKTSIIIPAYNEEKGIEKVLKKVLEVIDNSYEIIVVDDGSTDGTYDVVKRFNVKLLKHGKNLGKGTAIKAGINEASGKYILFIDADNTYPADVIPNMVSQLDAGYDVVTGSRFMGTIKGMSLLNKLGNKLITKLLNIAYGSKSSDPLSGLRGLKREHITKMDIVSNGFEVETEIMIKASRMGLKSIDIPIRYEERVGKTKLRPLKDGYLILRTIIKYMLI